MRCSLTSSGSKSLGGASKPPRLSTSETTPPPPWEGEVVARGLIPGQGSSSRTVWCVCVCVCVWREGGRERGGRERGRGGERGVYNGLSHQLLPHALH